MTRRTTVGQVLLERLKANGVAELFGIPGDFVLPFFKVIEDSAVLPLYTFSHEPGVGFAADAAARMTCRPSAAVVTYGAGALNMVNAVAAAYAEKSPLVVISGAPGLHERESGLLLHHQVKSIDSQWSIYREITCDQVQLHDPKTTAADIQRVLTSCHEQSRPVYIELPRDQVSAPCLAWSADSDAVAAEDVDQNTLTACAEDILSRLQAADAPLLMVGVEVRRYGLEQAVADLACKLNIPVVTSFMGRGLLAEHDAPLLGTYVGLAGDDAITGRVESADALLMLGVITSDTNLGVSRQQLRRRHVMHAVDGQVSVGYHHYQHISLTALVPALGERVSGFSPSAASYERHVYARGLVADDGPITPTDIATAINDLMAENERMPIASDMGDCLFTTLEIENTELVAPGYYATMGFGVPAGLGLQAATGRRPLILVGDGAFQMTGWELGHCQRYGWDPIVVLFNNASWEMLRTFQPESSFNDLNEWQFDRIADSLGGDGKRVYTRAELQAALVAANKRRGRFQLIEVMLAREVLSTSLSQFAAGLKRLHKKST